MQVDKYIEFPWVLQMWCSCQWFCLCVQVKQKKPIFKFQSFPHCAHMEICSLICSCYFAELVTVCNSVSWAHLRPKYLALKLSVSDCSNPACSVCSACSFSRNWLMTKCWKHFSVLICVLPASISLHTTILFCWNQVLHNFHIHLWAHFSFKEQPFHLVSLLCDENNHFFFDIIAYVLTFFIF